MREAILIEGNDARQPDLVFQRPRRGVRDHDAETHPLLECQAQRVVVHVVRLVCVRLFSGHGGFRLPIHMSVTVFVVPETDLVGVVMLRFGVAGVRHEEERSGDKHGHACDHPFFEVHTVSP